jgi:hypothetical protein
MGVKLVELLAASQEGHSVMELVIKVIQISEFHMCAMLLVIVGN